MDFLIPWSGMFDLRTRSIDREGGACLYTKESRAVQAINPENPYVLLPPGYSWTVYREKGTVYRNL